MYTPIHDLDRAKFAAKQLVRRDPNLRHSAALDAIAVALGYRDWHELSAHGAVGQSPRADRSAMRRFILRLAAATEISAGEVQYAVSRSRLLMDTPLGWDDQLALRGELWRATLFNDTKRGGQGTVVTDRVAGRRRRRGYLKAHGRPTWLIFDNGPGIVADFEFVTPRTPLPDFVPLRLWLPYGVWTLKDGSEVGFARDYLPLWRVSDTGLERLAPWLWISEIAAERHFFAEAGEADWHTPVAQALGIQWMADRRISELPRLVEAFPYLFEPDVKHISTASDRLRQASAEEPLPAYARSVRKAY